MRSLHATAFLVLTLVPGALAAQGSARSAAQMVAVAGSFPALTLKPTRVIDASTLSAEKVSILTVSPTGTIVLADAKAGQIIAIPPNGSRRQIGRAGEGPGEYRRVIALAWLHDTLVVLDDRLRRVSLFALTSGQHLGSFPYSNSATVGFLYALLNRGDGVVGVRALRGAPIRSADGGSIRSAPPVALFVPVTARGVGLAMEALRDSTVPESTGVDCEDSKGTVHIFDPLFPVRGSIWAFGSKGDLIGAIPDSLDLLVTSVTGGGPRRLVRAGGRVPIPQAVWDSVARPYLDVVKAQGKLTCSAPMSRPALMPMVRAIATDERGQIWIETTSPKGGGVLKGMTSEGKPIGEVALPPRDEAVPWYIRSGRIYLVTKDVDDLQSVVEYTVARDR